jgi:hypothetical protein
MLPGISGSIDMKDEWPMVPGIVADIPSGVMMESRKFHDHFVPYRIELSGFRHDIFTGGGS